MVTAFVILCGVALFELYIIFMLYVAVAMYRAEDKRQHRAVDPVETVTVKWREADD